ncbi:MAG: hypothetical protein ACJAUG_001918 [Halioglobus sp.]|jgi:hypothetical protein
MGVFLILVALLAIFLAPENTFRTAQLRDRLRALNQHNDIEVVVSHDLADMPAVLQLD